MSGIFHSETFYVRLFLQYGMKKASVVYSFRPGHTFFPAEKRIVGTASAETGFAFADVRILWQTDRNGIFPVTPTGQEIKE